MKTVSSMSPERRAKLEPYFGQPQVLDCGCAFLGSERCDVCERHGMSGPCGDCGTVGAKHDLNECITRLKAQRDEARAAGGDK